MKTVRSCQNAEAKGVTMNSNYSLEQLDNKFRNQSLGLRCSEVVDNANFLLHIDNRNEEPEEPNGNIITEASPPGQPLAPAPPPRTTSIQANLSKILISVKNENTPSDDKPIELMMKPDFRQGNSNLNFGQLQAYVKLEQLGEGSYATVYKGFSNLLNKVVALKEIRLQPEEGTPFTAIREASLLRGLRHANIVTLHDIIHTKENLTFVFEYVQTDLSQYLEKHSGGLNPKNIKLFLFQLFRGLEFCHEKRILHRDLKPQNLLISEIGELKLADFGLARAKSVPSRTYSHEVVTLWYRPPDVLLGSTDYSTSLDIWGVGCIFIEMIVGSAAFPGVKDTCDQLDKIWRVLGTPTEETWKGISYYPNYIPENLTFHKPKPLSHFFPKLANIKNAEEIAYSCLQLQPEKRITAENALRHKYFKELPNKIHSLSPQTSIFTLSACKLHPESNCSTSFLRSAARLENSKFNIRR
ncbi:cyclin-dependent kinase 14-like protein [Leptotrombidium deliense]|uniref:cyclin-dependent kinase n=1 Tax=Leptotrombidium deliense TaxID=299467 RepID=A0A443SVZ4_9ACAR|nr:cyclin-dependent kinase 14-like protein [Leptotrombidium deliense]